MWWYTAILFQKMSSLMRESNCLLYFQLCISLSVMSLSGEFVVVSLSVVCILCLVINFFYFQIKWATYIFYILKVDMRRANNCEIMLTKIKMPLPDMMVHRVILCYDAKETNVE